MTVRMVIDTDTASDDAVALAMALRHPDVDVVAITTVAGNCPVEVSTRNALYTAELCGADVPVYAGAAGPLVVDAQFGTWFHGEDGLGDQGYPLPTRGPELTDAPAALADAIRANPGCILVTLGPLTNVVVALRQAPDIVDLVGRCVVMGGTVNAVGNVTPAAEFNLWFDPHAARAVFASGLPIEMAPWEICRGEAGLDGGEQEALRSLDTPLAHFFLDCNSTAMEAARRQSGTRRMELPDPTAMAVALDKHSIVTGSSQHYVEVEADSPLTRGMSVVDSLNVTGNPPNVEVVTAIDVQRFKQMLFQAAQ
ncbi:MAG: nucleoside hydrolase [bacterium]|nr:nucleoside hydrolase [bacterium]MDE0287516.1 nucleoside hydrolase [bacterium]MDE0437757.1 nucleoside hydrolase [bacterium]